MPSADCENCGRLTNSATSDYWLPDNKEIGEVTKCYAAFVDGKWIKGCCYDQADPQKRSIMDKLITGACDPQNVPLEGGRVKSPEIGDRVLDTLGCIAGTVIEVIDHRTVKTSIHIVPVIVVTNGKNEWLVEGYGSKDNDMDV
jgi:hypothetical protein